MESIKRIKKEKKVLNYGSVWKQIAAVAFAHDGCFKLQTLIVMHFIITEISRFFSPKCLWFKHHLAVCNDHGAPGKYCILVLR